MCVLMRLSHLDLSVDSTSCDTSKRRLASWWEETKRSTITKPTKRSLCGLSTLVINLLHLWIIYPRPWKSLWYGNVESISLTGWTFCCRLSEKECLILRSWNESGLSFTSGHHLNFRPNWIGGEVVLKRLHSGIVISTQARDEKGLGPRGTIFAADGRGARQDFWDLDRYRYEASSDTNAIPDFASDHSRHSVWGCSLTGGCSCSHGSVVCLQSPLW